MWDSAWGKSIGWNHGAKGSNARKSPRRGVRLGCETLEGRALLASASLAPIATVTVPATLGIQVPLDGSGAGGDNQTYTATSNNPNIAATVAQGKFVTFNVTHTSSGAATDPSFSGAITYELFNDLTPLTATTIENIVSSGFYNGKQLFRVSAGFPGTSDFIIQGGSPNNTSAGGASGQPGTPFPDEFNQQLAFTGNYQLAMANSGPDTNDTQFFTTDSLSTPPAGPRFLDFHHTIYGQVVSGQNLVDDMTKVAKQSDGTTPVSPITITSATVSTTNPNGVVHINAIQAVAGQTATVTVTATDSTSNTTATQTFQVNAVANTQVERPFVNQLPSIAVGQGQVAVFRIPSVSPTPNDPLTYTVQGGAPTTSGGAFVALQHGTATVDQTTGIVRLTPTAGYNGPITVLYGVRDQTNRAGTTSLDDPQNYEYHTFTLTVNSNSTAVSLVPIAVPFAQSVVTNTATPIALQGDNTNPGTTSALTYALTLPPGHGTVSNFNASTGTFTYTPATGFNGADIFQYTVTATGGGLTTPLTSTPATITLNVAAVPPTPPASADTGAVRLIGNVLVVTPLPRTDRGTNVITITQVPNVTNTTTDVVEVTVNGVLDSIMPAPTTLDRIVVYGSKASDQITIDPSVTVPALTLDGGHGGKNALTAGSTATREHGWFGLNTLTGGTGPNQLVGRAGHVKFVPTATTNEIFAGVPQHNTDRNHPKPPVGTFFKVKNGHVTTLATHKAAKKY